MLVPQTRPTGPSEGPAIVFWIRGSQVAFEDGTTDPPPPGALFVGTVHGRHCWAVDLPDREEGSPGPEVRLTDLMTLFGSVDETMWLAAGRAVQLVEWARTHRFCGRCGTRDRGIAGRAGPTLPTLRPARVPEARARGDHSRRARRRQGTAGTKCSLAGRDVLVPGGLRGTGRDPRGGGTPRGEGGGGDRDRRSELSQQSALAVSPLSDARLRSRGTGEARSIATARRSQTPSGSCRDELPDLPGPVSIARRLIDAWVQRSGGPGRL